MLGGGSFTAQNRQMPGSYINFVSAAGSTDVLTKRGIAAMPFVADWGPEETVVKIKAESFEQDSLRLLGYDYTHNQMQALREIFKNADMLLFYRLNSGTTKAANELAEAVYGGNRGNDIKLVVRKNVNNELLYDVQTLIDNKAVDIQTVQNMAGLKANDFVSFKSDAQIQETVGMPLSGGSDGSGRTGEAYQKFLNKIEAYSFNALGCNTGEAAVVSLFAAFTKRMRDEAGRKFQTVVYRAQNADYEGVISVENKLLNVNTELFGEFSLVYWMTGAAAGCEINKSNTNKLYNGEYEIDTDYTQTQLEDAIKNGKLMFHKVGDNIRILRDINTLVTLTEEKGEDFKNNQTIRVLDQIGNDVAAIFNTKYLGIMPNDQSSRVSLWDAIVSYYKELAKFRAIEDVKAADITVEAGKTKTSVVVSAPVTPINCMEQMYMTVVVS